MRRLVFPSLIAASLASILLLTGCTAAIESNTVVSITTPTDASVTAPTRNNTLALDLRAGLGIDLTSDTYPAIGATDYTLPLNQTMTEVFFAADQPAQGIKQHVIYPHSAFSEATLVAQLKAGTLDMALLDKPVWDNVFDEELEYILIGREALTLATAASNPVDSLTAAQVTALYTDHSITDWMTVGGDSGRIQLTQYADALPLDDAAGQTNALPPYGRTDLLRRTLLRDGALNGRFLTVAEQAALVQTGAGFRLATYREQGDYVLDAVPLYGLLWSLHLSIVDNDFSRIKPIAIDGNLPDNAAIAEESYPYLLRTYAVMRRETPTNAPARAVAAWLADDNRCRGHKCACGVGLLDGIDPDLYNRFVSV